MTQRFISTRHLLALTIFAVLLMGPALLFGPSGGDLHCQSIYTKLFAAQFWHGDLYPRWLQDMFAGDGAPVFFYYPPVTYYITALLAFLAPLDFYGYTPIVVSAFLAVLVSGLAFYAWMKEETQNPDAALIGSLLYMAMPSHVGDTFFGLLLFSTVWAYAWVPMLMLLARRIMEARAYAVPAFALVLGLLIMTNEPVTIICGPLVVAYGLLYLKREEWKRQVMRLGIGVVLGFALSAIYLLPAQLYRDYANIDLFWKTGHGHTFNIRYLFFMNYHNVECRTRTFCWYAGAILAFIYLRGVEQKRMRWFFLGSLCLALFMMLPLSAPIWESVTLLKMLQMSERFFVVVTLSLSVFAALATARFKWVSYAVIVACLCLGYFIASKTTTTVEKDMQRDPRAFEAYTQHVDQYGVYLTSPELFDTYTSEKLADLKAHPGKVFVIDGDARVEVKKWEPRSKLIHYKATQESILQVRQFDFPGYQALLGDKILDITRNDDTGRIMLTVPPGEGDISLELTALVPEEAGKLISLLSGVALLLMVLLEARRRENAKPLISTAN